MTHSLLSALPFALVGLAAVAAPPDSLLAPLLTIAFLVITLALLVSAFSTPRPDRSAPRAGSVRDLDGGFFAGADGDCGGDGGGGD